MKYLLDRKVLVAIALVMFFALFHDFYRKYVIEHELDPPRTTTKIKRGLDIY